MLIQKYLGDIVNLFALNPAENLDKAHQIFVNLIIAYAIMFTVWRINEFAIAQFEVRGMRDMGIRCFRAIQAHSHHFFSNSFTGSLVKKVSRMTNAFESIMDTLYFRVFNSFLRLVIGVWVFASIKPVVAIFFVIWAISFIGISTGFAVWKRKYDVISAAADSAVSGALADAFGNYTTVKVFAKETAEQWRFTGVTDDWYKKTMFTWNLSNWFNVVQSLFMIGIEIFIFYKGIEWWKEGSISVGDFVFMQTYLFTIFNYLWDIGRSIRDLFRQLANALEMVEILEKPLDVTDIPHAKALEMKEGNIEFNDVDFAYNENCNIFSNFSLNIEAKEKVALVGTSGAGKSTIVKMLLRLYNIRSGNILIDGQNIAEVTQESLRQNVSLVAQDTDLFHRTIAENIAYGRHNATQAEIEEAAKKAQAHDFIMRFPKGYQTLVGERGVKLSGGEKQRIAIARAILEDAKILVLDEATSALDSSTEIEIQKAIENAMQGKTVIIIAHRLSTIKKADRVVVLEFGKIVEEGNHEQLLKRQGKYAELWAHQVGGFIQG